jgi:hypothetical protein
VKPCSEFSDILIAKLAVLQQHTFAAVQQALYLKELECDFQVILVIVLCDFAENYPSHYKIRHRDAIGIMPMQIFTLCDLFPGITFRRIATHQLNNNFCLSYT